MFYRLFKEHPEAVQETYVQHAMFASRFALKLAAAAGAALVHAVVPALFEKTASRIVADLYAKTHNRGNYNLGRCAFKFAQFQHTDQSNQSGGKHPHHHGKRRFVKLLPDDRGKDHAAECGDRVDRAGGGACNMAQRFHGQRGQIADAKADHHKNRHEPQVKQRKIKPITKPLDQRVDQYNCGCGHKHHHCIKRQCPHAKAYHK